MNKNNNNLPTFVTASSIEEIKSLEPIIKKICSKHQTILKILENKHNKPDIKALQKETKIIQLAAHFQKPISMLESWIQDENKLDLTLKNYLNGIQTLVQELEQIVITNQKFLYRKRLLEHYKFTINSLLLRTKAMDIINYCLDKLKNEGVV